MLVYLPMSDRGALKIVPSFRVYDGALIGRILLAVPFLTFVR